jgi:hypothetical protein
MSLVIEHRRSHSRLFDDRGVLLARAVHLSHGLADLRNAAALFGHRAVYFTDQLIHVVDRVHGLAHGMPHRPHALHSSAATIAAIRSVQGVIARADLRVVVNCHPRSTGPPSAMQQK